MKPDRSDKLAELFDRVLQLPETERPAFLHEHCPDTELRAEIESLLAHHSRDFLSDPGHLRREPRTPPEPDTPTAIGPYEVIRELGRGGMGVVYLARQSLPLRRQVAVKLIKWGMDTRQVIARFETERQALALMEHPNIARVFDAGATALGRPYFAMEYVDGVPITKYCDKQQLDVHRRLELFLEVCEGIQHAHQRGIIHRDIKPGNILVTAHENRPRPKVIDFGVAKATDSELLQATIYTESAQLVGTPEYMSPEQADLKRRDIDTRADVYSLGALLYELLVGAPPFDTASFRSSGYDEMRRRIREEDPPTPSTRISITGKPSATAAARRHPDAAGLAKRIRGDLDWITMKALEKDRERRYSSVSQFADDIKRYLADQPVSAGPPGQLYRIQKFVRRHRAGTGFAVVLLLLLASSAIILGLQARRVERERDAARQIVSYLGELLGEHSLQASGSPGQAAATLRIRMEEVQTRFADRPEARIRLLETIAGLSEDLDLYDTAIEGRRAVLELQQQVGRDGLEAARSRQALATVLVRAARYAEAESLLRPALQVRIGKLGEGHAEVAVTRHVLALARWNLNDFEEAEALFRQALETIRDQLPPVDSRVVGILRDYGRFLQNRGRYARAEELLRRALNRARKLGPEAPDVAAAAAEDLALLFHEQGRFGRAEALLQEALALARASLGLRHPQVASLFASIALARAERLDLRRWSQAGPLGLASRAAEMHSRLLGKVHPRTARSRLIVATIQQIVSRATVEDSQSVLGTYRELLPEEHTRLAASEILAGRSLTLSGRPEEAEPLLRAARRTRKQHLGSTHWKTAESTSTLGLALLAQGRFEEAESLLLESIGVFEAGSSAPPRALRETLEHLLVLYTAIGEIGSAAEYRQRLRSLLRGQPITHGEFANQRYSWIRSQDGHSTEIDYDDDAIRKRFDIPAAQLAGAELATLWVYGKPSNWPGHDFADREDYYIRVNAVMSQEIPFDVGLAFGYLSDTFQWVPFDIPLGWLVAGENIFWLSERPPPGAWTHNNLLVGIDIDTDQDDSWWCGSDTSACGEDAEGDASDRRGELMVSLELQGPHGVSSEDTGAYELRQLERTGRLSWWVAACLESREQYAAAERLYRPALTIARRLNEPRQVARIESGLGGSLTGLGRYDEAEPLLLQGFENLRSLVDIEATAPLTRDALERIVRFYEAVGRETEADRYRAMLP